MNLQDEIDDVRKDIKTDSYQMSIGEFVNLYKEGEVDIHPEFQRFYRWTEPQKSRFIESLLLGIPIPPIFVAQSKEGTWDVVDGVQRLSTIFELFGILKNEQDELCPPLKLMKTTYLSALQGMYFENDENPETSFTQTQRLLIKRAKLDVSIVLKESDEKAQYELFQRLNTGGSQLSEQEVRNCMIVMLDKNFYTWLKSISDVNSFQQTIAITDKAKSEQYDQELALRFAIFRKMTQQDLSKIVDVGDFITDKMVEIIKFKRINFLEEKNAFEWTFDKILSSLGENAFRRFDSRSGKQLGGFVLSVFEVLTLGLGYYYGKHDFTDGDIKGNYEKLWNNDQFLQYSGSGVRGNTRIPKLITVGRKLFKP